MSYTKGDIIKEALAEIGLGAFAYSLQPEDKATALRRLNAMLAEWEVDGLKTGYIPTATPGQDRFSDDSLIEDYAVRAVILNLACEIAPNYGKQVSQKTATGAVKGRKIVRRENAEVPSRGFDYTAVPLGAGHKRAREPFVTPVEDDDGDVSGSSIVILPG